MKTIILVLLAAFLLAIATVFAVDFYFYLINRYCRFHIGRWGKKSWEEAVCRVAVKWAKRTPTVKITDNSRYILLDMLQGKYRSHSIQSWQNAAIILGLLEKNDIHAACKSSKRFINSHGQWVEQPVAVDSAMLAYAILKAIDNPGYVKPAMDFMISLINQNTDDNGLISYTGGRDNPERYVDTIGLVCPFLALYGRVYHVPYYEDLAYQQLKFYHDYGLLPGTQLPNHAINAESKLPLGVYGWGRGVAWYVLGLMDTYCELQNNRYRNDVRTWILAAAESYIYHQHLDGGFGSIMQRHSSYDSSCTAVMAYFFAACGLLSNHTQYMQTAEHCLKKLKSVTRITGEIDWCQGDTKEIGIFSQTYDIMPFAQGFTLRAISIMKNKG